MDGTGLQHGFRLGEWLVEPASGRISGPRGAFILSREQLALLLCLAGRHGEAVPLHELRRCVWPDDGGSTALLRADIRALREQLGGSPQDRHYIASVGREEFALVAHFEPLAAGAEAGGTSAAPATAPMPISLAGRAQRFVAELRRRNVLKVSGAYLVGMWIVLQVAETTFEPLRLPDWWMTGLTILTVLGLPIVAVLAWSYEITPGGIVLDEGTVAGVKLPRARRAIAPVAVAGVAMMAVVTGVAWWRSIETPVAAARTAQDPGHASVAVLPLVDMSPAGGNEYLGDGLSEELSAKLAQIPGLRVAARTSAFEFKGRNVDIRRIGEALGVRHVLEGSVRRDGDSLRVTVQLIDAAQGYHVWAGSYDRSWRDVIGIQDEIARSVTEALRVVLAPGTAPGSRPADVDVRAIDPYLAGRALLRQSGDTSRLQEAAQRFTEALRIEPRFARAHAGLCEVGARLYARKRDPADLARAEASCREALRLDPAQQETEQALSSLYLGSGRIEESLALQRQVVARQPGDADGHIGLARALEAAGRFAEAEASYRAAVQAEPAFWGAHAALGQFLFARGQIDPAIDAFREVTELAPSSAVAFNNLGAALQMKGDLPGASEAYGRSLAIEPSGATYSNVGTTFYFLGEFEKAAESYSRATALAGQDQSLWGNLADALWQLPGRRDEALGYYRRAIVLAERDIATSGPNPVLLAQLGYYYGRTGDGAASQRHLQRAADGGEDVYVSYYAAVAAADRGDADAARRAANEAVRLGYPAALLRADPSLAGVQLTTTTGG